MILPIHTNPMDEEWCKRIQDCWWYHSNNKAPSYVDPNFFNLRNLLLSFGGQEACMPTGVDEDLPKMLERGQLWYGDRIDMLKGTPSRCHENSSLCWYANIDRVVLCTGYALSEDGMWREHSWCVDIRPRKNRIIETTVPRIAYFGFAMTKEEAFEFYRQNT
jgi:hypothetical protein